VGKDDQEIKDDGHLLDFDSLSYLQLSLRISKASTPRQEYV